MSLGFRHPLVPYNLRFWGTRGSSAGKLGLRRQVEEEYLPSYLLMCHKFQLTSPLICLPEVLKNRSGLPEPELKMGPWI